MGMAVVSYCWNELSILYLQMLSAEGFTFTIEDGKITEIEINF